MLALTLPPIVPDTVLSAAVVVKVPVAGQSSPEAGGVLHIVSDSVDAPNGATVPVAVATSPK